MAVDWQFVTQHLHDDAVSLRLRHPGADMADTILQIECRQKASRKLRDTLAEHQRFLFPTTLSAEQCTSDALAAFHATLVPEDSRIIDLTAGLGIDAFHIARHASHVTCVERDPIVAAALSPNACGLGLQNVDVVCADCRELPVDSRYGVAFIDPARRGPQGERLYALSQCQPDVVQMLPKLLQMADTLIVKASPMLDITQTIRELGPELRILQAVGTTTECKELLAVLTFGPPQEAPAVQAVTILADGSASVIGIHSKTQTEPRLPRVGDILIEPYPALMKAGAQRASAPWHPVHPSVPLFTADEPLPHLGIAWRILEVLPYSSATLKALKKRRLETQVAVRGLPIKAVELERRLSVTPSDHQRLVVSDTCDGPKILLLQRP